MSVSFSQIGGYFVITDNVLGITYSGNTPLQFKKSGNSSIQVIASNLGYSGNPSVIGSYLLSDITSIGGEPTESTLDLVILQLDGLLTNGVVYHTYVSSIRNLTFAANATAVLEIIGSPSKKVKIIELEAWVTSSATATNIDVSVIRQTSLCTGGTSTSLPKVAFDSAAPASTATVKAYTVNPTLGTAAGTVSIHNILVTLSASTVASPIAFEEEHSLDTALVLNNDTESYILSFNGNAVAATRSADIYITYVEY